MSMFDAPEIVRNIREMKIIWGLDDAAYREIDDAIAGVDGDSIIATAREDRVRLIEEELGISPLPTDTIEDRRFRIMARINDAPPYNEYYIRKKLTALLGEDGYEMSIENKNLTCTLSLMRKSNLVAVLDMLEELVSLDILINVTLRFNKWSRVGTALNTWGEVKAYTWHDIKEEWYEIDEKLQPVVARIRGQR